MDTDEFLKRCDEIEKGLHRLADDLYSVVEENVSGAEKDNVVGRSKEKVRLYEELQALLDDEDHKQEATGRLGGYVESLQEDIQRLEAGG